VYLELNSFHDRIILLPPINIDWLGFPIKGFITPSTEPGVKRTETFGFIFILGCKKGVKTQEDRPLYWKRKNALAFYNVRALDEKGFVIPAIWRYDQTFSLLGASATVRPTTDQLIH